MLASVGLFPDELEPPIHSITRWDEIVYIRTSNQNNLMHKRIEIRVSMYVIDGRIAD